MDKENMPKLTILQTGDTFKVYEVTGKEGMIMPKHYSTKEAVVLVKEGSGRLLIAEKEHLLSKGSAFIIPAGVSHSLTLLADFRANIVMENTSNIEFSK